MKKRGKYDAGFKARVALEAVSVERVIPTLKEQCIYRKRVDSNQHATRAIGDWINFYNNQRPHQAIGMRTPAAVGLAA